MKGYKGFEKGLVCRGKQYAENTVFEEESAEICKIGMHFCDLPHAVFQYYSPGENHEFAVVESIDDPVTDDNRKYCCKTLKICEKISVFDMVKISVSAYFENFNFSEKIARTKKSDGASNSGYHGASNSGHHGASNSGDYGASNSGYHGASNSGDHGASNSGNWGASNSGYHGASNSGNWGASNSGDWGTAVSGVDGASSCGENGVAVSRGKKGTVKGGIGALIVLAEISEEGNAARYHAKMVDGSEIKADTWYKLDNGEFVEVDDD